MPSKEDKYNSLVDVTHPLDVIVCVGNIRKIMLPSSAEVGKRIVLSLEKKKSLRAYCLSNLPLPPTSGYSGKRAQSSTRKNAESVTCRHSRREQVSTPTVLCGEETLCMD